MYCGTGTLVKACWEWTLGRLRRPRLNHVLEDGYISKGMFGMDAWTPSASSIYHVLGDEYISKGMLGMDARTSSASST